MPFVPKKILIVEDQLDVADLLEEMLSLDQYQVIKIHSSTGALSVIRAENPDVVLLDIMMPDVSGLEVLRPSVFIVTADSLKATLEDHLLRLERIVKDIGMGVGERLGLKNWA